jgi:hypothetical protein
VGSSRFETLALSIFKRLIVVAISIFSLRAHAILPVFAYDMYASSELINPQTSEVDLSTLSKLCMLSDPYRFHMEDYVPLKGVAVTDSGDQIARQIIQHTLQNLFDNHKNQYSGIIASTQKISENIKTQMGTSKNSVTMRFQPFSTKAEVAYSGELPVQSSLSYVASQNEARFEISKKLTPNKTVAYTHISDVDQQKDMIGIKWNF